MGSGRVAIDAHRTHVEMGDVNRAVDNLMRDTHQSIIRRFDTAIASPRRQNYYLHVLLACALAPTDHLGRFRAVEVREPYSSIRGADHDIPSYSRHLHVLSSEERGAVLQKYGEAHNFRFRFSDPMMQPFVIMQGLRKGLIGLDAIRPHNV